MYYKDHLQEFLAITSDYTEYALDLKPSFFRKYLSRTTYLKPLTSVNDKFEEKKETKEMDLFGKNEKLYEDTSAYLHASNLEHLNQFDSNAAFCFKEHEAEKIEKITKEIVSLSVTFLICAHRHYFLRFNDYTKSLIFDIYDKSVKHQFRKFANI